MIVGIGVDIVEVKRFEYPRISDNMLGEQERIDYEKANNKPAYLAKQFAAKEACIKATGVWAGLSDIQILRHPSGSPYVKSEYFDDYTIQLSISDETEYAVAFAIAEKA